MSTRPITGRKVLFFMVSAFGLIIAVNLTMAFKAVSTFPGLETKNSYLASQQFQAAREAQLALGWTVGAEMEDGVLRLTITGEDGAPVEAATLEALVGRATHVNADQTPDFVFDGRGYVALLALEPGNWNIRMVATAEDGTLFRQRVPFYVSATR